MEIFFSLLVAAVISSSRAQLPSHVKFEDENVKNYQVILFDIIGKQIIVGAEDGFVQLSPNLEKKAVIAWPSDESATETCIQKYSEPGECHNFVRLLESDGKVLLACGTGSYNPKCVVKSLKDLSSDVRKMSGKNKVPSSRKTPSAAVITPEFTLLTGGYEDDLDGNGSFFLFPNFAVDNGTSLRAKKGDTNFFYDPIFVHSFSEHRWGFVLFSEVALDSTKKEEQVYARIGRVCLNDRGGKGKLKNYWTTFIKARLKCSDGQIEYNVIKKGSYSAQGLVAATFSSQDGKHSAVCVFSMKDIRVTLRSTFIYRDSPGGIWTPQDNTFDEKCQTQRSDEKGEKLIFIQKPVTPLGGKPIHTSAGTNLGAITLNEVKYDRRGEFQGGTLYVADDAGNILLLSFDKQTSSIVSSWPISGKGAVRDMGLAFDGLYLALDSKVIKVKVEVKVVVNPPYKDKLRLKTRSVTKEPPEQLAESRASRIPADDRSPFVLLHLALSVITVKLCTH